jgi:hypothetical protein
LDEDEDFSDFSSDDDEFLSKNLPPMMPMMGLSLTK